MFQCTHSWRLSEPKDGVVSGVCVKCSAVGEWRDGTASKVVPPKDGFKRFVSSVTALLKDMQEEKASLSARLRELEPQMMMLSAAVKELGRKEKEAGVSKPNWTPEKREAARERMRKVRQARIVKKSLGQDDG